LVRKMRIVIARFYKNDVEGPTTGLHVAGATVSTRYALEIVQANKKRSGSLRAGHRLLRNIRRLTILGASWPLQPLTSRWEKKRISFSHPFLVAS
jgi:hypothetical protein